MRREFPSKVMSLRFKYCSGFCEMCGVKLMTGKINYDHDKTDAEGGEPTFENCRVLCRPCHVIKTNTDVKRMAKTERMKRKHIGAVKKKWVWPSRPFPQRQA